MSAHQMPPGAVPTTSRCLAQGKAVLATLLLASFTVACRSESYRTTMTSPPPVMREFRGVWIPTVANSCWPSRPGLTTQQQKRELLALLDRAAELKLNAVIFQVRPACDALYKSDIEPWSEYLTGTQGKAPSPYYDPLEFAVKEAHKRGLELHAWFNPFRAAHPSAKSAFAPNHISQRRPDLTRRYGNLRWLDPGEPAVRDYSLRVVMDVVRRYNVDGIHFDDYFYPYPEKDGAGRDLPFPDNASWKKYGANSGLTREDWRRHNVDEFIQRVYRSIHETKPYVKFGISPFGIWRPKNPPSIEGLDAYNKLYADSRKWLREGWCDYLAPQLYWAIEQKEQSFPVLLKWWCSQNPKKRHLWPGLNALKVGNGWNAQEISRQIEFVRKQAASGEILWSATALMNSASLRSVLDRKLYHQPALVPRFPWLDSTAPTRPSISAATSANRVIVHWTAAGAEKPWLWVVQSKQFGDWKAEILPGHQGSLSFDMKPDFVAITAVDRCGNASSPAVLKRVK